MFPLALIPPLEETGYFASDWRMSDDAIFHLSRLLLLNKPTKILETGPGMSSYVFFSYQKLMRKEEDVDVVYHIIDEAGEWHDRFKDRMGKKYGFPFHSVWSVPLKDDYYDIDKFDFGVMDFISLDGPGESGHRNSEAARRFLDKHMGPKTIFLIDDTNRPAERDLAEWVYKRRLDRFGSAALPHDYSTSLIWDTLYPKRYTTFIVPSSAGV